MCPKNKYLFWILVVVLGILCIAFAIYVYMRRHAGQDTWKQFKHLSGPLKIMVSWLQIATMLHARLDFIQWPHTFTSTMNIFSVLAKGLDSVRIWFGCSSTHGLLFYDIFFITICAPVAFSFMIGCVAFVRRHMGGDNEAVRVQSVNGILVMLFLVCPLVAARVFDFFVCIDVDGKHFLQADLRISCDSEEYSSYVGIAVAAIVIYPIGEHPNQSIHQQVNDE